MYDRDLPVVVIGAGPIGLTAAALLHERGIPFVVFERGDDVGASVAEWGHVPLFTPWALNVDPTVAVLLDADGWAVPDQSDHPTGTELVERFLVPLARTAPIASALRTGHEVVAVARHGIDKLRSAGREEAPFVVVTEHGGTIDRTLAAAVIDASGTWTSPNPLGTDGHPAPGEVAARERVTYGIPDVLGAERDRFASRRVAVVGSGHSARHVVRDLVQLAHDAHGGDIAWVTRRSSLDALLGGDATDVLAERARLMADARRLVDAGDVGLETDFGTSEVSRTADGVELGAVDGRRIGPFDEVVAATGFRPDHSMLGELRLALDPALESSRALASLIDPNVHSCGSVPLHGAAELAHPEPNLFVVGAKSYGRAPTFLLTTGYHQARSVVAELADDRAATPAPVPVGVAAPSSCGSPATSGCTPAVDVPVAAPGPDDVACCG